MKRTIFATAALILFAHLGASAGVPYTNPLTFDQVKANVEFLKEVAGTNAPAAQELVHDVIRPLRDVQLFGTDDVTAYCTSLDAELDVFGLRGLGLECLNKQDRFPKIDQRAFNRIGIESSCPRIVSLARKYKRSIGYFGYNEQNTTLNELVSLLNENIALVNGTCPGVGFNIYGYNSYSHFRKNVQSAGVRIMKRYLRKQGKSVLAKNGNNPLSEYLTELNTAINAPYLNGLEAWFAKFGETVLIDTSHLPSPDEVNVLRDQILNYEKDMSPENAFVLKVCLGVDGFNAFAKEYNGEN